MRYSDAPSPSSSPFDMGEAWKSEQGRAQAAMVCPTHVRPAVTRQGLHQEFPQPFHPTHTLHTWRHRSVLAQALRRWAPAQAGLTLAICKNPAAKEL